MPNLGMLRQRLPLPRIAGSLSLLLSLCLSPGWADAVRAKTPETAPAELKQVLSQIEAAANRHNIEGIMQFYGSDFTSSSGLGRSELSKALTQLWERYPELNYRTELQSWETAGDEIVAETVTYITGSRQSEGRTIKLQSTLRSRQRLQGQEIVQRQVLAERTKLTSGSNPPEVRVRIPEKVRPGERFNFDVIATEPLGEDVLLGTALEQPVTGDRYLKPSNLDLEVLPAGGIYRIGEAPASPGNRWLSAVLVRENGITAVTQRLRVVEGSATSTPPSQQ